MSTFDLFAKTGLGYGAGTERRAPPPLSLALTFTSLELRDAAMEDFDNMEASLGYARAIMTKTGNDR